MSYWRDKRALLTGGTGLLHRMLYLFRKPFYAYGR